MTNKNKPSTAVSIALLVEHVRTHVRTKEALGKLSQEPPSALQEATVEALNANMRYIRFLHSWLQEQGASVDAIESVMKAAGFDFQNN